MYIVQGHYYNILFRRHRLLCCYLQHSPRLSSQHGVARSHRTHFCRTLWYGQIYYIQGFEEGSNLYFILVPTLRAFMKRRAQFQPIHLVVMSLTVNRDFPLVAPATLDSALMHPHLFPCTLSTSTLRPIQSNHGKALPMLISIFFWQSRTIPCR